MARNPEIRWRLRPSDIEELHDKQVSLIRKGLEYLAPNGVLVYSTCSLEHRENEAVIDAIGRPAEISRRLPGFDPGDGFFTAVLRSNSP
ncbi:MAG: hypothetical protein WKF37_15050 [Bryobacteraceae bacterium]